MFRFTKYVTDGSDPLIVEYKGLDGLLTHTVCKRWKEKAGFHRFSVAHGYNGTDISRITLMAEFDEGRKWYIVGFLSDDPDLPVFDALEKK